MSEVSHDTLRDALEDLARQLRPVSRSPFIPIIKFANDLGVDVQICIYSTNIRRDAQSYVDHHNPRITLYRKGSAEGVVHLSAESEHLLKPRERFSIAHELGHILAYNNFGVVPVSEKSDRSEYWKQEECVNSFAEALLVPSWLTEQWLLNAPKNKPVSIGNLKSWAYDQCHISVEVVTRALAKVGSYIGFIKIEEGVRVSNNARLFAVRYSSGGREVILPNLHSLIEDPQFTHMISGSHGTGRIETCRFGTAKCENLSAEWQESPGSGTSSARRIQPDVKFSGKMYWVSLREDDPREMNSSDQLGQLNLFD